MVREQGNTSRGPANPRSQQASGTRPTQSSPSRHAPSQVDSEDSDSGKRGRRALCGTTVSHHRPGVERRRIRAPGQQCHRQQCHRQQCHPHVSVGRGVRPEDTQAALADAPPLASPIDEGMQEAPEPTATLRSREKKGEGLEVSRHTMPGSLIHPERAPRIAALPRAPRLLNRDGTTTDQGGNAIRPAAYDPLQLRPSPLTGQQLCAPTAPPARPPS